MTVYTNGLIESPDLHNSDTINPAFIMCYHVFLLLYCNFQSVDFVPRHNPGGAHSLVACLGFLLTNISNWQTSLCVINRIKYNGLYRRLHVQLKFNIYKRFSSVQWNMFSLSSRATNGRIPFNV